MFRYMSLTIHTFLFVQHAFPTDPVYTSRHSEWHHLGGDHPFWGQVSLLSLFDGP